MYIISGFIRFYFFINFFYRRLRKINNTILIKMGVRELIEVFSELFERQS